MIKTRYFIANWKAYLASDASLSFATEYYDEFVGLAQRPATQLILCPSFEVLYPLVSIFKKTNIVFGAQDCSEHKTGPFTGQILASSLKSLGCSYSVIGHSERRQYACESDDMILKKCIQLLEQEISPIICFGENQKEFEAEKTFDILSKQLFHIFEYCASHQSSLTHLPILLAYEPVWAIGSGRIPDKNHLETVFAWLENSCTKFQLKLPILLLYGGSVNSQTIQSLKTIPKIDGFLIGGASLNFQEFKNIVCSF